MARTPTLLRPAPWLVLCIAVPSTLAAITVNYWNGFPSPNERTRAYQALAVATRGSLSIEQEVRRFGGMEDVSSHAGRVFPNKAPGLLPLLLPAAAVARLSPEPVTQLRLTLAFGRLLAASAPTLLTVLLLAGLVADRWPRGGPLTVMMWTLASPALSASLLLFAHALTSLLVLSAYALLFEARPGVRKGLAAGLVLGWAFACEYQLALPALVLFLLALPLWGRRILAVVAGGFLPLALLGAYNQACFGSLFTLSSAHEANPAFADLASQGVFGIAAPTFSGLVGLLASPSRGLLTFAPFVLLGVAAARNRATSGPSLAPAPLLLAPLALLLLMSGYPNWHGGMFPGPRYLLGVLPLLAVAAASGAERLAQRRWGLALLAFFFLWGATAIWPITATFPFPPPLEPFPSLLLAPDLARWGAWFPSWLPATVSTMVWILAAIASVLAFITATGDRRAFVAGALVTLVAAAVAATTPKPQDWPALVARAVIHDVFVGAPPGALERLRARCTTAAQCAQVDSWILRRGAVDAAP